MRSTRSRATLRTVSWPSSSTRWARRSRAVRSRPGRSMGCGRSARGQVVGRALMIVGGVACGYLAELGWKVPWLVCTALFAVTAALAAATMRETRARAVPRSLGRTALDGLGVVRAAPVLILL